MSGVKHTPGPWRISTDNATVGPEDGFAPFGACGCCNSPWMMADDDQTALADARLIAAAPDLLKAGQNVVEEWGMRTGDDDALLPSSKQPESIAALMRALARARGEQDGGGS